MKVTMTPTISNVLIVTKYSLQMTIIMKYGRHIARNVDVKLNTKRRKNKMKFNSAEGMYHYLCNNGELYNFSSGREFYLCSCVTAYL